VILYALLTILCVAEFCKLMTSD